MSALVVSLHDVSPLTREAFTRMLADLAAIGVTKTSLLVIPDHHHRGQMLNDAGFCRWLEGLAKVGHEVVIHGYYHQRVPRGNESARQRWVTSIYTQGEGEFFDLSGNEASVLLARAKQDFGRLDIPAPTGFIAPAWLLGNAAHDAVVDADFRYTTYLTCVKCLSAEYNKGELAYERSQSLVYSCHRLWRRLCSLVWNAALRRRLRRLLLMRLGLHPPDLQHSQIWRQILRFAREEADRRDVTTYDAFVGQRFPVASVTSL